ncbi:MAG: O-antigen ligase family protein [Paludibacteraceae bacterium]|nr:O-antigen ligase family protein [Paludibacteraceae bacterium]
MTLKRLFDILEEYSLYLFAFFCCFYQKLSSIFFVIWGSCWIVNNLFTLISEKKIALTWTKEKIPAALLLSLSIIGLLTITYASDSSLVFKRIFEQRLSILLVPIAILIGCKKINLKTLLYFFIYGNLFFVLLSFLHIFIVYIEMTEIRLYVNFLFYCSDVFLDFLHRSYSNLNIILGLIGLIFLWSKGKDKFLVFTTIIYIIPAILFIIVNNSRGETIALCFLIAYYVILTFFKSKKKAIYTGLSIFVLATLATIFFPENRTIQTLKNITTENNEVHKDPRMNIWKSAKVLIQEHPFIGYGVNNYEEPLNQQFNQADFSDGSFYEYNTHNQYIGFQLEYGIIGLLIFLALLTSFIICTSKDERKFLSIPICIVWTLSFLFESFLDRYNGCASFSMTLLLLSIARKNELPFHLENKKIFYYPISIIVCTIISLFLYSYISSYNQEGTYQINNTLFKDDFQGSKVFHFDPSGPYAFVLNNEIHGYKQFAAANLTADQSGVFEVEAYLSEDFNGKSFCISVERNNGQCTELCIYDSSKKGEWQKLQVKLTEGIQSILCLQIHQPDVYKEKTGAVYLRNPQMIITENAPTQAN